MVTQKKSILKTRTNITVSNPVLKLLKHSNINSYFSRLLPFLLLLSNSLFAQIVFDVKTTMEEKSQLHIIKLAVINAIEQSNWARVTEYNEDYSLWLTNFKRKSEDNSFKSDIDLDLRTPAMISRGKHIRGVYVSVTFDTSGISRVQVSNDTLMTNLLVQGIRSSGMMEEFSTLITNSIPFGFYFLNSFTQQVLSEINRQPTPMETYEANLLAAKAVVELKKLFDDN